ncbi:phosphocholine cytidylyltransferase family protein [Aliifodinibius salicampi]|uniref:Phosphocholine cytidylyltransferase family protein n=1 Tax=Fodinibius salicampi TaxID=1920655 RepID=A0ABT3Q0B8_9BACT|nr:phosphocholine cytidylyltransferase family protein [Fodinibius salicampi]MCW9713573.1 phosphocholine cytidylyltransferase family protein [Fodinibius salicampi]
MNNDYTAIILAAGKGTRLRPLTNNTPKCMVPVDGKPLLGRQLDLLTQLGIEKNIVVTGYLEEKIADPRITKVHNTEYDTTNMVYSLFCAKNYLSGDVIVAYGDIIYSEQVLQKLLQSEKDMVIASDEAWLSYWQQRCDDPLSDAETFKKGAGNRVESLGQTPSSTDDIEGQFIGLIKFSENGCQRLKEEYATANKSDAWESGRTLQNAYMTDMLNYFALKGELHYVPIQRGWFEVDTPRDLKIASDQISQPFAENTGQ